MGELINKAKQAASSEEIFEIAKENNYPMTEEDAKNLFVQLHAEGELDDDELDTVAGGGCSTKTKVGGQKYTVVTNHCQCFTGKYERGFRLTYDSNNNWEFRYSLNKDNYDLRRAWVWGLKRDDKKCGSCLHLQFKGSLGYCDQS